MRFACLLLFAIPTSLFAQFKYDNVLYKTVSWQEFCRDFPTQKNALILDVRSKGEYDDTSGNAGLNIGRLIGSKHINVMDLGNRIHELDNYKNKPVYIYCSHSQRSRRSSKMLVDSGFTNVININGGLTDLYTEDGAKLPCKNNIIETANNYTQLNAKEVHDLLQDISSVQIIDVRNDSVFKGWTGNAKDRAMGKLKHAVNIPLAAVEKSLDKINKQQHILVVDAGGGDAARVANFLTANGYKKVSIVFDGLDAWLTLPSEEKKWTTNLWEQNIAYNILDGEGFNQLDKQDVSIVDVRNADEFQNRASQAWRNRGHIKNAINMPVETIETRYQEVPKNKPVIIYSFSNTPESYEAAEFFSSHGYKNVSVLTPGIWGLRYQAYNNPSSSHLKDLVVEIPEENL